MNTTSYGLMEGLLIVSTLIIPLVLIWVFRYLTYKNEWKKISLVYGTIILCIILDTLMWVFNIETGIIAIKLYLGESLEQLTVFSILALILAIYSNFMKLDKGKEDEEDKIDIISKM